VLQGNLFGIHNAMDMMGEYFDERNDDFVDQSLSGYMLKIPKTLPQNVLLSDQLTPSRSSVEAASDAMPAKVEEGVNFITSNHTMVAFHIASAYRNIPPALADYLTARIVYDRRHAENAPLPQKNEATDGKSGFNLKKQVEFQEGWNQKLGHINALWDLSQIKK
jgi:hypothetical protein